MMNMEFQLGEGKGVLEMEGADGAQHCECA